MTEPQNNRRACECAEPDPVMQADRKFYCHTCSFETGARPRGLEPENRLAAAEATIARLTEERDRWRRAMENHLCPAEIADWLACSGGHGAECAVCDEADQGQHRHGLVVRAEAAEASLRVVTEERDRLKAQVAEFAECSSIWCPYEKRMHEAEASLRVLHEGIREVHVEMRDYVSRPECNRFDIQRWIDRLARLGSPGQESHV